MGDVCFYCGVTLTPKAKRKPNPLMSSRTRDHVIPKCRRPMPSDGNHFRSRGNIVSACFQCNGDKGFLFLSEWEEKIEEELAGLRAFCLSGARRDLLEARLARLSEIRSQIPECLYYGTRHLEVDEARKFMESGVPT